MRPEYILVSAIVVAALASAHGYEENNKFCIHTQPMLLADIEKHKNPTEGDPRCEIFATTMTEKEKESFINTMCKDHQGIKQRDDDYQYFKLRNGELSGRGTYKDICNDTANPLLAWVPYQMIQRSFMQYLNPKERTNYIAKATEVGREKTDLCYFRHFDLVTNVSDSLFSCVLMLTEDNFFGLDAHINILVEIQPIMYEVRNVTYLPWMNVTGSYKTKLGASSLKNPSRNEKTIYGSIYYAFVEKIKLNTSSVYGETLDHLPLLFEHKTAVLELDSNGEGQLDVKDKAYFGRTMDGKSHVNVEVIGQWAEHQREFTAQIYEYFGYGIRRFSHDMQNGRANFITIDNTEPVFEMKDTPLKRAQQAEQQSERLTNINVETNVVDSDDDDLPTGPTGGHPYPGFYPYAVAGAIIMFIVIISALIGAVRTCNRDKKLQKYELASP